MNKHSPANLFEKELSNWLYAGDPLLRLLVTKLNMTPSRIWIIAFLLVFVLGQIVYSWAIGYLVSGPGVIGALNDWSNLFFLAISTPFIWAFYIWMPKGIVEVFTQLKQNRVFAIDEDEELVKALFPVSHGESSNKDILDKPLRFLKKTSDKYLWILFSIICVVAFSAFVITPLLFRERPPRWNIMNQTYFFFFYTPITDLAALMVATMAVRQTLMILWLTKLFKTVPIDVHPLHPDNCGGLKPLGDYSLKIAYLISIMGFDITVVAFAPVTRGQPFEWTIELIIYYSLYLLLAPVLFMLPLIAAHKAMKTKKREVLLEISRQFEENHERTCELLDKALVKKRIERMKELEAFYEMTQSSFPVWPFDLGVLRKFIAVVVAPLLPSVGFDLIFRVLLLIGS
jgi:hypothetical protein